jgi:hypothetical protein
LARKNQAAAAIKEFQARAEAESEKKLGVLRTDRGGEFTSVEFAEYCAGEGVRRQLTAPIARSKMEWSSGATGRWWR